MICLYSLYIPKSISPMSRIVVMMRSCVLVAMPSFNTLVRIVRTDGTPCEIGETGHVRIFSAVNVSIV